jgi:serine/threonine-protein kinase
MSTFFEQLREALAPEYLLERELGSGGMGSVFLARDVALDCPVAIKAIRPEDASAAAVERFQSEAQTLAKLRHPHIVRVHFCSIARGLGVPYYVMDIWTARRWNSGSMNRGPWPRRIPFASVTSCWMR